MSARATTGTALARGAADAPAGASGGATTAAADAGAGDGASGSATTAAAVAFVEAHRALAAETADRLVPLMDDPERFTASLEDGLRGLADPVFADGLRRIAPGITGPLGVRGPLLHLVESGVRRGTRRAAPARLLALADRAARSEVAEVRWFAIDIADRIVRADPERTWQLIRRIAGTAAEWITVDSLASPCSRGILAEPYRWAELEQLVYSPSRWERRLAGSTVARIPFIDRTEGRRAVVAGRGLDIVGLLIGDAELDVCKALSWALRSLVLVDRAAVVAFCREQADLAASTGDGARAWVIRDTLPRLDPADAEEIGPRVMGIRRRPGAPSTSLAAEAAARFGGLADPAPHPTAPLP
jgi:3-methyladenine DNA glycosylase AlkD